MAQELVLGLVGMAGVAAGAWRIESRGPRASAAPAVLLCLGGIVIIAIAATRASAGWSLRIGILGEYSAAGGLLGSTGAAFLARRRAGAILAGLGAAVTTGFKIVSAVAISGGALSVVMQFIDTHKDTHKPGSPLMLGGQAMIFAIFGIQAVLLARTRWSLAERGIIGPNVFVPWQQVLACDWQDSNTLAVAMKPGFRGARRLRIPVAPEAHDHADAVLAGKKFGDTTLQSS